MKSLHKRLSISITPGIYAQVRKEATRLTRAHRKRVYVTDVIEQRLRQAYTLGDTKANLEELRTFVVGVDSRLQRIEAAHERLSRRVRKFEPTER